MARLLISFFSKYFKSFFRVWSRLFIGCVLLIPVLQGCEFDGSVLTLSPKTATVQVQVPIPLLTSTSELRPKASLGVYSDIVSLTVDVVDTGGGSTYYISGQLLTLTGSRYVGTLSGLPLGVSLDFVAHAYNSSSVEIFTGTAATSLSSSVRSISVYLSAIDDGITSLSIIDQIILPGAIPVGTSATITIKIKGGASETLTYTLTAVTGGGAFTPSSGTVSLDSAGDGSISTTYTAAGAVGTYPNTVEVIDGHGNKVKQAFDTILTP